MTNDYTDAGFDSFLSRSIDSQPQANLDTGGPVSTQMRYDSSQSTGSVGDSFAVGNIIINGKDGGSITIKDEHSDAAIVINGRDRRIEILDTNNTRVIAGQLPDTSYGWAVSKPGVNVQNGF